MDTITVEILADGSLKTATDAVSAANHSNAEKFLMDLAQGMGGKVQGKIPNGPRARYGGQGPAGTERASHTHTQARSQSHTQAHTLKGQDYEHT
jgi:hypothetical protein